MFFFFNDTATTEIYTLSLHDALPIYGAAAVPGNAWSGRGRRPRHNGLGRPAGRDDVDGRALRHGSAHDRAADHVRSEEHTSELQSPCNLVCRLLLEKKKTAHSTTTRD